MKSIFTIEHPFNDIVSIDIFSPTRGVNGTLSYAAKIDNLTFSFEMNDDGDWAITSDHILLSPDVLNLINATIFGEEAKRLKIVHSIHSASILHS